MGSLATLGPGAEGIQVRKAIAQYLGLVNLPITWHVARDGLTEITNLLATTPARENCVRYHHVVE